MQREILIIDAEGALEAALRERGYGCARAGTAQEALPLAQGGDFALAVLNVEWADERWAELIGLLRAKAGLAVLAIAPAGKRERVVELLDAGAEDYLTRPFELRELEERIEVLLCRFAKAQPRSTLRYKELELNPETYSVTLRAEPVKLTKQEFKIVELMMLSAPGRVFSKQDYFDYAWEHGYMGIDKTINVHICNIRRKFRAITEEPYIETIWGLGFRLV